ncbi:hypothetical protein ABG067_005415, partial [Albugo candida]
LILRFKQGALKLLRHEEHLVISFPYHASFEKETGLEQSDCSASYRSKSLVLTNTFLYNDTSTYLEQMSRIQSQLEHVRSIAFWFSSSSRQTMKCFHLDA